MNFQEKVKQFQIASGQSVSDVPYTLTKEEFEFRDNLLREEIRELKSAIVDFNKVEILDALCDIKYVNDGTANMLGIIQEDDELELLYNYEKAFDLREYLELLEDCFTCIAVDQINDIVYAIAYLFSFSLDNFNIALNRVHESNMSKFCLDTKTAERTQDFYQKQGIETYIEPRNKITVVYRKGDGKVLKSINYHPVLLEDLV